MLLLTSRTWVLAGDQPFMERSRRDTQRYHREMTRFVRRVRAYEARHRKPLPLRSQQAESSQPLARQPTEPPVPLSRPISSDFGADERGSGAGAPQDVLPSLVATIELPQQASLEQQQQDDGRDGESDVEDLLFSQHSVMLND